MLDQQYIPILAVHGATGLMAKLSFLAGLILVQQENLRKHSVIMTWILMVHFVVGTFTTAAAGITSMSVVAGLMVALCGASLAMENGSWRGLPNGQPWRGLAILGYIVVLWFPLWPAQGVARALFFSPMSALPHQDILAVMILCMVSGATRSRLLTWGSCAAAIIVGILELKGGSVARGVIMVTASASFGVIPLMNFSRNAAQDLSDGIKSQRAVDPIAHDSEKPRKKWDLK